MSIQLSNLTEKLAANVVDSDIFLISDSTSANDNKITRSELSKSFNSFTAQNSSGLSFYESAGSYGLSISGVYGFVGINDLTPYVSLDVSDNVTSTNGSGQIRMSTANSGRKIGISLSDPNVYYQFSKKPNDTKLYLESSVNGGSTFTNLLVVDQSGRFAITDSTGALTRKFLCSGEIIEFQNSGNSILFDPYNNEIRTNATDEVLLLNYNNLGDIKIGNNVIYVDNDLVFPKVGIGTVNPSAALNVSGSGIVIRVDGSTNNSTIAVGNTSNSGYFGIINNKIYIGPSRGDSAGNIIYNNAGFGSLGLGTENPQYKFDVNTISDQTIAHFANTGTAKTAEIIIAANKALGGGDTGPRNSFVTFSRFDSTVDTDKWSIGNIYNDTTFGGSDDLVFIKDGYFGASPNVVAKLSTAGSLDIDGSYTSNNDYCKGRFVQVYQTRVTGYDIYFNPLYPNSNSNPSGHNSIYAPFTLTNFPGRVERVMITTSDDAVAGYDYRFEISAITQIYNPATPDQYVSGFSISPPSDPAAYPTSGIIGATYFRSINDNITYVKTRANFTGTTSFSSGQLLQYRLCEFNGTKTDPINFTVVTTISYNIT
jgi:hypothetical protein